MVFLYSIIFTFSLFVFAILVKAWWGLRKTTTGTLCDRLAEMDKRSKDRFAVASEFINGVEHVKMSDAAALWMEDDPMAPQVSPSATGDAPAGATDSPEEHPDVIPTNLPHPADMEVVFRSPAAANFWKKYARGLGPVYAEVVKKLLQILDQGGETHPSVIRMPGMEEPDNKYTHPLFDKFQKISLLQHSINCAEMIIPLTTGSLVYNSAIIAALGHDIGKHPAYLTLACAVNNHPSVSVSVINPLITNLPAPQITSIIEAIRFHHKVEKSGTLVRMLKQADEQAREHESMVADSMAGGLMPPVMDTHEEQDTYDEISADMDESPDVEEFDDAVDLTEYDAADFDDPLEELSIEVENGAPCVDIPAADFDSPPPSLSMEGVDDPFAAHETPAPNPVPGPTPASSSKHQGPTAEAEGPLKEGTPKAPTAKPAAAPAPTPGATFAVPGFTDVEAVKPRAEFTPTKSMPELSGGSKKKKKGNADAINIPWFDVKHFLSELKDNINSPFNKGLDAFSMSDGYCYFSSECLVNTLVQLAVQQQWKPIESLNEDPDRKKDLIAFLCEALKAEGALATELLPSNRPPGLWYFIVTYVGNNSKRNWLLPVRGESFTNDISAFESMKEGTKAAKIISVTPD